MFPRTQVFVDTSYLLASFYNSWETGARGQLEIDLPEVVCVLSRMIEEQLGQPIHRQLWYDGLPDSGPHRYQRALRTCNGVILRAGQLIEWGERRTQKAVDTRLVADMVLSAVRGICSDIVLVSGDADMIPGVQEASNAGIRVHLYGFGWDSMSSALRHTCDSTTILDPREDFADCMRLEALEGPLPPQIRTKPIGDAEPLEDDSPCTVPEHTAHNPTAADSERSDGNDEDYPQQEPHRVETAQPAEGRLIRPGEPAETEDDRPFSSEGTCEDDGDDAATPTAQAGITPAHLSGASMETVSQPTPGDPDITLTNGDTREETFREGTDSSESTQVTSPATAPGTATPCGEETPGAARERSENQHKPAPKPSMMAPRRKLRSRYVPLPNEVWSSAGYQTPFDVGQQYASWWYDNAASSDQRDQAHMLSGGGLPPEIDRPLLQFACETLHEYTLTETQRVSLRDGFHSGIRGVLINLTKRT